MGWLWDSPGEADLKRKKKAAFQKAADEKWRKSLKRPGPQPAPLPQAEATKPGSMPAAPLPQAPPKTPPPPKKKKETYREYGEGIKGAIDRKNKALAEAMGN